MINGVCRRTAVSRPVITAFAGRHAERSAHEIEILNGNRDHLTFQSAYADLHRVLQSGLGPRIFEAIGVTALVAKFQRIDRDLGQH